MAHDRFAAPAASDPSPPSPSPRRPRRHPPPSPVTCHPTAPGRQPPLQLQSAEGHRLTTLNALAGLNIGQSLVYHDLFKPGDCKKLAQHLEGPAGCVC